MDRLSNGQVLTNPLDDTFLHWHTCKNCSTQFTCCDPLCGGGLFDAELCPDCRETLNGIW